MTLLALTAGIASLVSLVGIANGFRGSFASIYTSHGVDLVVSRQGSADRLSASVDVRYIAEIASLPPVQHATGVLLETLSLEQKQVFGIPTMGMLADDWLMEGYSLRDGRLLHSSDKQGLLLGVHLADRLGAKVGDSLEIFDEPYQVIGIFKSQSAWENGSMILRLEELQELVDRDGQVTYINVSLRADGEATSSMENTLSGIERLDAKLLPLPTKDFVESDTRMQLASAMAWMTSMVALMMGGIGILNTMMTSVLERTQEIGILRAIGWPRGMILRMILCESCTLGLVASCIGFGVAVLLTTILSRQSAVKGLLDPRFDVYLFAQAMLLGITIGLVGALIPAWRAARMVPTEAFRHL